MTNIHFQHNSLALTLCRYPSRHQHKSLQAWNSADVLLMEHATQNLPADNTSITICNDEFGALSCMLLAQRPSWRIQAHSDSWISQRATLENLQRNRKNEESLTLLDSLSPLSSSNLVLLKIPRSLALLEWQLSQIQHAMPENTPIVAGAKVNALTPSVFKLFERYCGPVTTSLARKKSRLLFTTLEHAPTAFHKYPSRYSTSAQETRTPFTLINHANVFSRQNLDIGARVILNHLPSLKPTSEPKIIDLGCGNGVLGLTLLALHPTLKVTFVDESFMALASARASVEHNLPESISRCRFMASNCLEEYAPEHLGEADLVICNPPFHQQNTVTEHIARQMFRDAHRVLKHRGELRVVANRHLPYGQALKKQFGGFKVIASEKKFVVLSSIKMR